MLRRLIHWLFPMATDEESAYYDYWDQVLDHMNVCRCPKRRNVHTHCERHREDADGRCVQHAHTYDYDSQP
jgi:hypothetical protein